MNNATFDLITEPWIPVVGRDGHAEKVGLRALFDRAHELREVSDPSPLTTFALYRLLLAVTQSALRGPNSPVEWKALWKQGRFKSDQVSKYLDDWRERFDLFHEQHPFLQVAEFVTVKGNSPVTAPVIRLVLEISSGNNATLFDHTTELDPKALPADAAARALVVAQAWGLGGGQGPTSKNYGKHPYMAHAPCVGAVATLVWRETLFETLCANLAQLGDDVPFRSSPEDRPMWERDEPRPPTQSVPTGYLEFLTWPARHVRLLQEADGSVTSMYFAQGAPLDPEAGYDNPFASYRVTDSSGKLPVRLDPGRAIWRDSGALLAMPSAQASVRAPSAVRFCWEGRGRTVVGGDGVLNIACFGLANDKAKPLSWRAETISASVRVVQDPEAVAQLQNALGDVEAIGVALSDAVRKLAYFCLETGSKQPDRTEVSRIQSRLLGRTNFWDRIEDGFHEFIRSLTPEARVNWVQHASGVAKNALRRAGDFAQGSPARRQRALALAEQHLRRRLPSRKLTNPAAASIGAAK